MSNEEQERDEKATDYKEEDAEDAAVDPEAPARWFFCTSLFPLIGATFGPIASVFSICALITHWRTNVDPSNTEAEGPYIPDPVWVLATNAISLVSALAANLALIAHMASRISFRLAHPIVTIGWFLASFLMIGIVAALPKHSNVGEHYTLTQAYYYACISAGLYLVLATLLILTAYGVHVGQYSREYKLTMTQRTLMMQTVAYLGYLLTAAGVYARIEGWNYLDAVYLADVTLFTIGFGDFKPQTHLGRSLFFPMAVGGIIFVGIIVAFVKSCVLDDAVRKVSRRNIEKVRRRFLHSADHARLQSMSELDRRRAQFEIMRRVQTSAKFMNSIIAFSVSLGVVLSLWLLGAVAFWKAESLSTGGQDWTYFESFSKPAFVFWSLLALPALTVLVGSLSDVVVAGFNSLLLFMANHLPGKTTSMRNLKNAAPKVVESDGHTEIKPPGFMDDNAENGNEHFDNEAHANAVQGLCNDNSKGQQYRPYLLMKALKEVIEHDNASPPRQYSFEEWAWIMKLLNVDESDKKAHDGEKQGKGQGQEVGTFSWAGENSPLMSTDDEPKWVMSRLIEALERELKSLGDHGNGSVMR